MAKDTARIPFTGYQKFVIFILAITLFTVVLDFMVMSPLGDMMMKSMNMTTKQFGIAVSCYAFSAGASGLLTAGFADKFDRKKLLMFFYTGFIAGTFFCSAVRNFELLVVARIVTGLFGGVIGSIATAIITDIFDIHHRGRVMGFVQMGFGASQVLGIPISLAIANHLGWPSPFVMVACLAVVILLLISFKLEPVTKHLAVQNNRNALSHLWHTVKKREYRIGFMATALLAIGGYMMMPFGSAFAINNLHITYAQLPKLFMVSGVCSLIVMPVIGRVSDKVDKFLIFTVATIWMCLVVVLYTHLSVTPLWEVMIFNVCMMIGIMSRFVPAGALTTAIPHMEDRGAFMSINASLQQIAGGIAAVFAGMIVEQKTKTSPLEHYDTVGYIMVAISMLGVFMMYRVSSMIKKRSNETKL
jgi:predicted MFS family arabinose efflux permease